MKKALIVLVLVVLVFASMVQAEPKDTNIILVDEPFVCRSAVDIDLLKVTMHANADAVSLSTGCSGRIGRIECDTWTQDCTKVQNASSNAAHDIVIQSGYARSHAWSAGTHQDCIQVMGGARISMSNFVFDCTGTGGGNYFVNRAGSGATTPTDIVCTHCAAGPNHNNPQAHVRINVSVRSGIRDSLVCRGNTRNPIFTGSSSAVNVNNTVVENSDPRCTFAGLMAYVNGAAPPPPPPVPAPELSDPPCATWAQRIKLCWPQLASVERFNYSRDGQHLSHTLNGTATSVIFGRVAGTHAYCVEAVYQAASARSCVSHTK